MLRLTLPFSASTEATVDIYFPFDDSLTVKFINIQTADRMNCSMTVIQLTEVFRRRSVTRMECFIQLILVSGISYGYPVIWKIQEVQTDLLWKSL